MTTDIPLDKIRPSDLPSPPQAAIQILRACTQEDVSSHRLSTLAEKDPVLTAELLRIVNSPFFGFSHDIQSLRHAVSILGLRTLRNTVLCLSVRDAIGKDAIPGFDTTPFWEDSLRRAVSARLLAGQAGCNEDECFTSGLLQDFGLLVMFYLDPGKTGHWNTLRAMDPTQRLQREQELFGSTHTRMIAFLARSWNLPEELGMILSTHHSCTEDMAMESDVNQTLRHILYCADWMDAVFHAADKEKTLNECRRLLMDNLHISETAATEYLNKLSGEVEKAASSLGLHIGRQPDFEQVMTQVNISLAKANLSYQELTWKLEQTLKERDRLAAELERELSLAREIQESLLPKNPGDDFPITGVNVAARQLSGDFFDYFRLRDGRIYFSLADVSGKGVNAALLMAKTCSLFHCLGKRIHEPDKLLAYINDEICETAIRGMFITMIAGIYDPGNGEIRLVNAGNPPAFILHGDGRINLIEATSPPLGILPGSNFPLADKVSLARDDLLYMFSDGAIENQLQDGEPLGLRGLLKLIVARRHKAPKDQLNAIMGEFRSASDELHDDITMLMIKG